MLVLLMLLGRPREGWWQLGRLNYDRVVRVGGEPEGAAGGEGREHRRISRELGWTWQGSQDRQPDDAKSLKYKYSLRDGKTVLTDRTVHPDVVSLRSVLDN